MPDRPLPPKRDFNWGRFSKTLSFWVLIILIPVAFIQLTHAGSEQSPTISYTQYDNELSRRNIRKVTIQAGKCGHGEFNQPVRVKDREVRKFNMRFPVDNPADEVKRLRDAGAVIEATDARPSFAGYLVTFLP